MRDDAQAGILDGREDPRCGIGRPVVDDDERERRVRLPEDAVDGLSQVGRTVEHGHDEGDVGAGRVRHRHRSSPRGR